METKSTLEELESASKAAQLCLLRVLTVKSEIESQPEGLASSRLAEAMRESTGNHSFVQNQASRGASCGASLPDVHGTCAVS
jgi:hypothetical protein